MVFGIWPPPGRRQFGTALDAGAVFEVYQFLLEVQLPVAKIKVCRRRFGTPHAAVSRKN